MMLHNVATKGNMEYWEEHYIHQRLHLKNSRTLLSGWGGDELITYNGYSYISGLFAQKKIFSALKYLLSEKK